ncbi:MAG: hypothetical protein RMJ56_07795 [Gemmataceae bacterium]|nr:hypothetical protein [Gemmata sp.]MDW8197493.1 hypothetical protein [Gemmataceae bacterium]
MSRTVWLAGLLGGVVGALFSLVLARVFPAPAASPAPPPPSGARVFADEVVQLLKTGRYDEFFTILRPGFSELPDDEFQKLRDGVLATRQQFVTSYGAAGELEFCRETSISPALVRLTYLEKYQRGCVAWVIVVYDAPSGWQVLAFNFPSLKEVFATL